MESTRETSHIWRLRVELDDSPGALARITVRLADLGCNVLALAVLPVPGGVLDELVVRTEGDRLPADLVEAIRQEGGRCAGINHADLHDLVDGPAAALRAAIRAVRQPAAVPEAVREVLAADAVTPLTEPADTADDPHRAVLTTADGQRLVARRGWVPFTATELARARALLDLVGAIDPRPLGPTALRTTDGAALLLRAAEPADTEALGALHNRCSMRTLFARYHSGMRTLPRRWLHRLLAPPRGSTVLAQAGADVVAMGQLIRTATPEVAEISLLVEDSWQRRGVGTALLAHLAGVARAEGYRELVGWCLPTETGLPRTATRAGLPTATRTEDGLLRVSVRPTPDTVPDPAGQVSLARLA